MIPAKFSATLRSLPVAVYLLLCSTGIAIAQPSVAILDFELRDLTLLPEIPEEIARTASVKPMLEEELQSRGYSIIAIPLPAQKAASSGFGYLFDHDDVAAELGRRYQADYVVVGRLHKPSFLFMYLMAHVVEVKRGKLIADYLAEVKGGDKRLTKKGVESLAGKISSALSAAGPNP